MIGRRGGKQGGRVEDGDDRRDLPLGAPRLAGAGQRARPVRTWLGGARGTAIPAPIPAPMPNPLGAACPPSTRQSGASPPAAIVGPPAEACPPRGTIPTGATSPRGAISPPCATSPPGAYCPLGAIGPPGAICPPDARAGREPDARYGGVVVGNIGI